MDYEAIAYVTAGGIEITRNVRPASIELLDDYIARVENRLGGVLASGVDVPGRYSRWDIGYCDPPIVLTAHGRRLKVKACGARGKLLLPVIARTIETCSDDVFENSDESVTFVLPTQEGQFAEEERSNQPSVFTALRAVIRLFSNEIDRHLGLYGAFGYDLAFQFEPIELRNVRSDSHRDFVLHIPDEIFVVDRVRDECQLFSYEFCVDGQTTAGMPRTSVDSHWSPRTDPVPEKPKRGTYAGVVREAKKAFKRGDLFEVVPSQAFHAECTSPAAFFRRLSAANPAPFGFFFNLGSNEYLVGASPEMFVRVEGDRVESCPISGTIARGADPIEDAVNIQELLASEKDEAELTMCTDVDRNDKARICVPGSVSVIGRRQIELYSRLIHTVDHVEGQLLPNRDAIDAFLTHMWAVTITGAPKRWAMQFIEDHEEGPREWYGGAVGILGFNGSLNTGLTLRTAHIRQGIARIRAGATLLYDSDPDAEELESELKASALLGAVLDSPTAMPNSAVGPYLTQTPARVLLVDHEDSFVHNLAAYMRECGAQVTTLRWGFPATVLDDFSPDLLVLSPGPGKPSDFNCQALLEAAQQRQIPIFGVCLGLQAMVEWYGGRLVLLPEPVHGKASTVMVKDSKVFAGLEAEITVGRYHSLCADPQLIPDSLVVTAQTDDGVVMAIEHVEYPQWAVQFHPESIMSRRNRVGHGIISNVLQLAFEASRNRENN